jgi:hypothetical protein
VSRGASIGIRAAVAVVALLVVGWLAVLERDYRLQTRAITETGARGQARSADDLDRARFLNPDRNPDFLRALVIVGQGQYQQGKAIITGALRDEPDNLSGWNTLFLISSGRDPASVRLAIANLARLDPIGAQPLVARQRR